MKRSTALHPPSPSRSKNGGSSSSAGDRASRFPAGPRRIVRFASIRSRTADWNPARSSRSLGSATCTGVPTDRKRSAIHSSPLRASRMAPSGPDAAIQPSFICGSPQSFEIPPKTKVATRRSSLQLGRTSGRGGQGKSPNTSSEMIVIPRSAQIDSTAARSVGERHDPVGLFGSIRTTARVLGPIAASSESRSSAHRPSYARRYCRRCVPSSRASGARRG